ncbi:two-component system response regulator [bacterium (Candidatus Howlettbacteria) CG_4_10_14_0_8_um_filter_40_9]|nr:MAG: two-component system response regulator [bacterium (Candidatus Howlettbacteria) CG_4_10_14_0_8_um_filter_40_9]
MNPKIMIVDDDQKLCDLYRAVFTAQGYKVCVAQNGEEALTKVTEEKPDLVLLDIMMPNIHGLHILDIMKATPEVSNTKIIMLTALSDEQTKEKAMAYGATDFIVKSETTMGEVLERVQKALTRG